MLHLTIRRKEPDMYDINVHDFVKKNSDSKLFTRSSNDSGFLMIH